MRPSSLSQSYAEGASPSPELRKPLLLLSLKHSLSYPSSGSVSGPKSPGPSLIPKLKKLLLVPSLKDPPLSPQLRELLLVLCPKEPLLVTNSDRLF